MFDRFTSLSIRQQVGLIVSAVAVVCVMLTAVWFLVLRVPYRVLFAQLRSNDAAAIIAELDRKKIPYQLADGGATILVPADIADRTRLAVMTDELPLKGTVGFELFDRSDMGLTDFAQRINYQRALQGELERTIASLDGVDTARVHLSLGEQRIFRDDQVPPKASVTVRMQRGQTLSANAAAGIARLIAAAVPNLDVANVVVLDERGGIIPAASATQTAILSLTSVDEARRVVETYYQARVREALQQAYPLVSASVVVVAGSAQLPVSLADWSPATRNFPLVTTIVAPADIDSLTRDGMHDAVAAAIAFDPSKNDVVEFRAANLANRAPALSRAKPLAPALEAPNTDYMVPVLTLTMFLLLIVVAVLLLRRLGRPKRMSDTERARFAQKFRDLLKDGDSHAVS